MARMLWLVAVLAGCGTDAAEIELVVPGQPSSFMAQIAGRSWQTIEGSFDGFRSTYELSIDGDFALVMVCRDTATHVGEVFGTVDDAVITIGSWQPPCDVLPIVNPGPDVAVTGQLDRQGVVVIGTANPILVGAMTPFTFRLPVGTYDVLYITTDYSVAISHDRVVTGPTDLGVLSFAKASPMNTNEYSFSILQRESPRALTRVVTRNNTIAEFDYPQSAAVFVPSDQLMYGDMQTFVFTTEQRSGLATHFTDAPSQFDLLAPLAPFAWNPTTRSIQWTQTGDFFTTASATFFDATGSTEAVTASKRWIAEHDPQVLAVDESPPDFRWEIASGTNAVLDVQSWSSDLVLDTETIQAFPPVR